MDAPNISRTVQNPSVDHYGTLKEAQKHAPQDASLIVFHPQNGYIAKEGIIYPALYTVICTKKDNGRWSRRRDHLPYGGKGRQQSRIGTL